MNFLPADSDEQIQVDNESLSIIERTARLFYFLLGGRLTLALSDISEAKITDRASSLGLLVTNASPPNALNTLVVHLNGEPPMIILSIC